MKVSVKLPVEVESHWKRLLAVYGPDTETLAVAAVESLWKKYHKDVEAFEREREKEKAVYKRTRNALKMKVKKR